MVDTLILTKDEDGAVEAVELADVGELGALQALEVQLAAAGGEDRGGSEGRHTGPRARRENRRRGRGRHTWTAGDIPLRIQYTPYEDHGAPGERAVYHPGYYGAFVLDADGHNVEVVNHNRG